MNDTIKKAFWRGFEKTAETVFKEKSAAGIGNISEILSGLYNKAKNVKVPNKVFWPSAVGAGLIPTGMLGSIVSNSMQTNDLNTDNNEIDRLLDLRKSYGDFTPVPGHKYDMGYINKFMDLKNQYANSKDFPTKAYDREYINKIWAVLDEDKKIRDIIASHKARHNLDTSHIDKLLKDYEHTGLGNRLVSSIKNNPITYGLGAAAVGGAGIAGLMSYLNSRKKDKENEAENINTGMN